MVRYTTGNILDAETEAVVNTVNTVGVMGKGIALMFKQAYPENFRQYSDAVKRNEIGEPVGAEVDPELSDKKTLATPEQTGLDRGRASMGYGTADIERYITDLSPLWGWSYWPPCTGC